MKKYRFFFHYNKLLSQQTGKKMWSVHFKKKCYFCEQLKCKVMTESKTNKTQPYVVMQGYAENICWIDDKLIII